MIIAPEELTPRDRYYLMIGCIVPRPIALVSSLSREGVKNLAPFSYFGGVSSTPPVLSVAIASRRGKPKDTLSNIRETAEFVVNVVDERLAEQMNLASGDYPPEVDEFDVTGLTPVPSDLVSPPRVKESPIQMECRLFRVLDVGEPPNTTGLVLGEIVRFHLRDDLYQDGHVDPEMFAPLGRMGRQDYCRTTSRFSMKRPKLEA
jgi:flavin reductase (DIM6/NTAB) family NADH-FMN oxidoreductase RutF